MYVVTNISKRFNPIQVGPNRLMKGQSCELNRTTMLRNFDKLRKEIRNRRLKVQYRLDDGQLVGVDDRLHPRQPATPKPTNVKAHKPMAEKPEPVAEPVPDPDAQPTLEEIESAKKDQLAEWCEKFGVTGLSESPLKAELKDALLGVLYPDDEED